MHERFERAAESSTEHAHIYKVANSHGLFNDITSFKGFTTGPLVPMSRDVLWCGAKCSDECCDNDEPLRHWSQWRISSLGWRDMSS